MHEILSLKSEKCVRSSFEDVIKFYRWWQNINELTKQLPTAINERITTWDKPPRLYYTATFFRLLWVCVSSFSRARAIHRKYSLARCASNHLLIKYHCFNNGNSCNNFADKFISFITYFERLIPDINVSDAKDTKFRTFWLRFVCLCANQYNKIPIINYMTTESSRNWMDWNGICLGLRKVRCDRIIIP